MIIHRKIKSHIGTKLVPITTTLNLISSSIAIIEQNPFFVNP